MLREIVPKSIGFKFISNVPLIMVRGIGWEKITDHNYIWDGRKRSGDYCLLQYTISGRGEIEIKGKTYSLEKGDCFLVNVPGEHCYCLPKSSNYLEILYIEFSKEAMAFFHNINYIKGNVIHIEEDSKFLKQMWKVYEAALFDEIDSVYKCSNYAYGLIMELLDYYNHSQKKLSLNPKVSKSKEYIDNNYDKLIGLEEICEKVGVSKYYLCREFLKGIGLTPGNYLLKVRIQAAAKLLLFAKDMTVEEISQRVGFSCGNYFSKVFKKSLGVSPTEFRNNDNIYDINKIIFK